MRSRIFALGLAFVLLMGAVACNTNRNTARLDSDKVENSLKQAGYNDVRVDVDNDKAVVTLNGEVKSAEDKDRAEQIAKSSAPNFVVANQLSVQPEGAEGQAKDIQSNTDDAIKSEWQALEAKMKWDAQDINADVKNGVLTLKGDVDNMQLRSRIEKEAAKIPHVEQVVNELEVKAAGRKAKKPESEAAQE